eukprot:m.507305 g.507305  ORF g.507305 m.507305 type:complete len:245 (-) comp57383_c0_seq1:383-1117(-)
MESSELASSTCLAAQTRPTTACCPSITTSRQTFPWTAPGSVSKDSSRRRKPFRKLRLSSFEPIVRLSYFERRLEAASRLGCGAMLTEFDLSNDPTQGHTADVCDQLQISWIGWDYKAFAGSTVNGTCTGCGQPVFYPNGSVIESELRYLSGTYAQAVAGSIVSMSYNTTTLAFSLEYRIDRQCLLPTEIYFNQQSFYTAGFTVEVKPAVLASWSNPANNTIHIQHSALARTGDLLSVVLSAVQE